MKFLVSDPLSQFHAHKNEINTEIKKTLESGNYILGDQVSKFEKSFAKFCKVKYAIGVNSGTDALLLCLKSMDIGDGDEVITVSHTALATLSAIISSGAKPVVVDVDDEYYTMNPMAIVNAITKKTKAIIPVHIYGHACEMDSIMRIARKYKLRVIEDCAQAVGAKYNKKIVGSIGDVGAFSFYPTKNLGAIGDGGIITTNNKKIAKRIERIRQFGWDEARKTNEHGISSRLDELQAAILNVKLKYIEKDNKKRAKLARIYDRYIDQNKIKIPKVRNKSDHVYHLYVVISNQRDKIINELKKHNIFCGIHYSTPAHLHPGYREYCKVPEGKLTVTMKLSRTVLSLPMYPELKSDDIKKIVKKINLVIKNLEL